MPTVFILISLVHKLGVFAQIHEKVYFKNYIIKAYNIAEREENTENTDENHTK